MGQSPISGIVPASKDLKWRSGSKTEPVPSNIGGLTTYEKMMKSSEFKDFLLENLDGNYLISSILTANSVDENVLLEGISSFNRLDDETRDTMLSGIKSFQTACEAGINVGTLKYSITFFHVFIFLSFLIFFVPFVFR